MNAITERVRCVCVSERERERYDIHLPPLQLLEEPGEDSSRFDSVVPTIVRPPPSSTHLFDSEEPMELGILRQFTFSSELQVLVQFSCTMIVWSAVYTCTCSLVLYNDDYSTSTTAT